MKYKIIFDMGKPYTVDVQNDKYLKKELTIFYNKYKLSDEYFNVIILNENERDISETQFIQEMIEEIIGG